MAASGTNLSALLCPTLERTCKPIARRCINDESVKMVTYSFNKHTAVATIICKCLAHIFATLHCL